MKLKFILDDPQFMHYLFPSAVCKFAHHSQTLTLESIVYIKACKSEPLG